MKKRIIASVLALMMIATCVFALAACNKEDIPSSFEMPVGTRPNYDSLISAQDKAIIDKGVAESAKADDDETKDQDAIKKAVMALYNTANGSRINTPLSLVVQESDAGIEMAKVIMHSFNLRDGDKWYYQLATSVQPASDDPLYTVMAAAAAAFAGYLKVAYTNGDGNYWFFAGKGAAYSCDCSLVTFPYARFQIQEKDHPFESPLTLDEFNNKLHVLSGSIHEINNMDFCAEIIADNATIQLENGLYTVDFAIDMDSDAELLEKWFAKPQEDMKEGGQTIKYYNSYTATLQMWDNGYAKYFESHADRNAGTASGKPVDKYSYIWTEKEILDLVGQDVDIKAKDKYSLLDNVNQYIEAYSDPEYVNTIQLGFFDIFGIVVGCIAAVIIVIVVTIEVLVKKGKLPKLAAKREKAKQKRLAKKAAKNEKKIALIDENSDDVTIDGVFDNEDETASQSSGDSNGGDNAENDGDTDDGNDAQSDIDAPDEDNAQSEDKE